MLNSRLDSVVRPSPFGELDALLDDARKAIRLTDYSRAEQLLKQAESRKDRDLAEYYNLLGVVQEGQKNWRQARKCYEKAIDTLETYEPAKSNLQRLIQLRHGEGTNWAIQLGDEAVDLWFAKLPN